MEYAQVIIIMNPRIICVIEADESSKAIRMQVAEQRSRKAGMMNKDFLDKGGFVRRFC